MEVWGAPSSEAESGSQQGWVGRSLTYFQITDICHRDPCASSRLCSCSQDHHGCLRPPAKGHADSGGGGRPGSDVTAQPTTCEFLV